MAQNMVASQESSGKSVELMRGPRTFELVKLVCTATAVNDTSNAYTCQLVQNPAVCIGGNVVASFSGNTVTFTAVSAIGSNTIWVWIGNAI